MHSGTQGLIRYRVPRPGYGVLLVTSGTPEEVERAAWTLSDPLRR